MALFTPIELLTLRQAHKILADKGATRVGIELRGHNMATHWHAERAAEATINSLATIINAPEARLGPQESEDHDLG